MTRGDACALDESVEFRHEYSGKSWGTAPNPLKRMAFRATLRDPDGFGHIGWMIRLSGVFGAVARVPPSGFSNVVFSWGSGE